MENPDSDSGKVEAEDSAGKKRVAERQMRKEEDGDDDVQDEDSGSFKKADDQVIAQRRKVKVRRGNAPLVPENPVPEIPVPEVQQKAPLIWPTFNFSSQTTEKETKSAESVFSSTNTAPSSSPLTFQTSFTFNSTNSPSGFSIPIPNFSALAQGSTSSGIFGENIAKPSTIPTPSVVPAVEGSPTKVELSNEPVSSGEEGEQHAFQTRAKLFILELGTKDWKERGVGNLRLNIAKDKSYARLVMRVEGSLRLVLNVALWPAMKIEKAGDKAARFTAPHLDKPSDPCSYLVRVGRPENITDLIAAVESNKNLLGTTASSSSVTSPKKETKEEPASAPSTSETESNEKESNEKEPEAKAQKC